ncbi:CRISPR-associated endonuclease Cas2 [Thiocapsa imhoffii]|uniref:CRISPR-associated endonuclease Cas2 n=1 Tax=Thiocapsa imhoffii TaxID=382777 RepID=UPI001904009F|nr:CRISPR-associated endonuclease Cas2 [Thiocapsa imhoffii]
MHRTHWSLIAYDIRDPKRLRRIHRLLRKRAVAVQQSVFLIEADADTLAAIVEELRAHANTRTDDIRLYAIPHPAALWTAGTQCEQGAGLYTAMPSRSATRGVGRWLKGLFGRNAA